MLWSCFFLLLGGALAFDPSLYRGYKLIETTPTTMEQVKLLRDLSSQVDFWLEPVRALQAEMFVRPDNFDHVYSVLVKSGLDFTVSQRDFEAEMQEEWDGLVARGRLNQVYDINDYNTYADIMSEVDRLAGTCGNGLSCSSSDIGTAGEGRAIKQITLTTGAGKQRMLIDSNIHAREWIAVATTMNILDMMINGYGPDADVTRLLNTFDFVFVPVVNPDGYSFTWTDDRMWRKNRLDNEGSPCFGVDLNRNYNYAWGEPGAGTLPCDDTYRGPSAASEPETQATQTYYAGLNAVGFMSFHSHGYYLLTPYGDCSNPPEWLTDVQPVLNAGCAAIENTYGENWLCGNSCEQLYATSGSSVDWATGAAGVKYSFTPELRNDNRGFQPPASSIPLSVEQMWNGVIAIVDEIVVQEAD